MADQTTELLRNFAKLSPAMQSAVVKLVSAFVAESASTVVSASPVFVSGDTPQDRAVRFRHLVNTAANRRVRVWKWPTSPSKSAMQTMVARQVVSGVWERGWDVVTPTDAGPVINAILAADLASAVRSKIAELRHAAKRRAYLNAVLVANGQEPEAEVPDSRKR
ncbi:MAG: hypothetical protein K8U57_00385 [Planctomycetes bacterium]|nr:hypothetical protein [Planctomycetota bacterium]